MWFLVILKTQRSVTQVHRIHVHGSATPILLKYNSATRIPGVVMVAAFTFLKLCKFCSGSHPALINLFFYERCAFFTDRYL